MTKITKEQYEFALARIEELLPLVNGDTPTTDKNLVNCRLFLTWWRSTKQLITLLHNPL